MIGPESDHWLPFSLTKLEIGPAAKLDEFLEKFQMVFDPPPLIFWKIILQFFVMDMAAYMEGGMRVR